MTAYEYNSSLTLADIEYLNVNEVKNMTLEYDPHFGQEVFEEESGVHIPIEIYEGCEYTCVLSSSLTLVQVWAVIVGGHVTINEGCFYLLDPCRCTSRFKATNATHVIMEQILRCF